MSKDNEVTINQVRAIAEQIARVRNVTILEVTSREVQDILKRGSAGYLGAHLQTIKCEYARAKLLEEKQISHHYNSALYDEIKRHADNAREVALAEAEVTKQMFDEICESYNALEETLAGKEKVFADVQREHADEMRNLTSELHMTKEGKSNLEARLKDASERLDKTERELSDARTGFAVASVDLDHVTKERDGLQGTSEAQKNRILQLEKELAQSRDAVAKAEQRAELLNWKNDEICRDRDETKRKLDKMTERAATAEALLNAGGETPQTVGKSSVASSKR